MRIIITGQIQNLCDGDPTLATNTKKYKQIQNLGDGDPTLAAPTSKVKHPAALRHQPRLQRVDLATWRLQYQSG